MRTNQLIAGLRFVVCGLVLLPGIGSAFEAPPPETGTASRPILGNGAPLAAAYRVVGPDFFCRNGIRFVHGRNFSGEDHPDAQSVVIVNEMLAELLWPGEDAVGKYLAVGFGEPVLRLVVGVVADSASGCGERRPHVYIPSLQDPSQPLFLAA